jgi:hypothetical protein
MSKKVKGSANKSNHTAVSHTMSKTNKIILGLIFVLCLVTIYVVLTLQGEMEHQALMQRIDILNSIQGR